MIITSKYPGFCRACRKPIKVGEQISWSREHGARHLLCSPEGQAQQAAIAASCAANSDIEVPSPPNLEYLPFQRAGIAFANSRPATLFADEMGLGKTIQAIGVINADRSISNIVIVCPASLRLNWSRELGRWLVRPLTIGVVGKATDWPESNIVIVPWSLVTKVLQLRERDWDLAILDESHYAKNPKAARTKAVVGSEARGSKPAQLGIRARRRIALTGTPILNRPVEIFPVLHWLSPEDFPSFLRFAKRYCNAYKNRFGWDFSGASNLLELQSRLRASVMLRREKKDVLTELPPKLRQVVELPANGAARAIATEQQAWNRHEALRAEIEIAKTSDTDYAEAVARLRNASRIAFAELSAARKELALSKVEACIEHITDALEAGSPKIVVFAHHQEVISALARGLSDYSPVTLTGETAMADRQTAVDRFQTDPKFRVFIGSITAAGVGLTLTAAAHVVFVELDWVPANITQAEDRCHRIGQTESVLIQHLVLDGSLDSHMAHLIVAKQQTISSALNIDQLEVLSVEDEEAVAEAVAEVESLSELEIVSIHADLRYLANRCDGARARDNSGFNKLDSEIGKRLAALESLSVRQAMLGRRICCKYRRQLSSRSLGFGQC
jgi:SWI/SNF-related matrix-associated actin-dependent regulator 1 of chromatin subfamily A